MANLNKISTLDLIDELIGRNNVEYVVNESSCRDWNIMVENGKWTKGTGQVTILAIREVC